MTKLRRPPRSLAATPADFVFPYDDGEKVWTRPGVFWRKPGAPGPEHDFPGAARYFRDDDPSDDDDC